MSIESRYVSPWWIVANVSGGERELIAAILHHTATRDAVKTADGSPDPVEAKIYSLALST
jgi:hypothetical protein